MFIIIRIVVVALGLWAAEYFVEGVKVTTNDTGKKVLTLLAVAVIFGVVNAVIKPIVKTVGCAAYVLTLGLIALVVNALLFLLTGWIADKMDLPFQVDGFWAAFWGAIIVAVVSWLASLVLGGRDD
ncbi:phage holin family protein [Bailinhaonella thermotolerans]|uniref:Phage holin family protein n=1 Tax=Bailinhaonella thermotolerans TaxID=1070861 RepID=A0A3A4B333_9ACTN|nr:phage holin family protein [Bailinhaonella thermotolerans]RJL32459.1 phage holin family protein [Bailinhaonella thermotolerans]